MLSFTALITLFALATSTITAAAPTDGANQLLAHRKVPGIECAWICQSFPPRGTRCTPHPNPKMRGSPSLDCDCSDAGANAQIACNNCKIQHGYDANALHIQYKNTHQYCNTLGYPPVRQWK